jgi:hypothetical protein
MSERTISYGNYIIVNNNIHGPYNKIDITNIIEGCRELFKNCLMLKIKPKKPIPLEWE